MEITRCDRDWIAIDRAIIAVADHFFPGAITVVIAIVVARKSIPRSQPRPTTRRQGNHSQYQQNYKT